MGGSEDVSRGPQFAYPLPKLSVRSSEGAVVVVIVFFRKVKVGTTCSDYLAAPSIMISWNLGTPYSYYFSSLLYVWTPVVDKSRQEKGCFSFVYFS